MKESVVSADDGKPEQCMYLEAIDCFLVNDILVEYELGGGGHLEGEIAGDADVADGAMDGARLLKKEEARQREEEKHDLAIRLIIGLRLDFVACSGDVKSLAVVVVLRDVGGGP